MIIHGDCLEEMKKMEDNSISGIVCDPPYSLGFMGKIWDESLPSIDIWREALRVVKPGGFLLAFGGTRTYHRLTCSVEDAGWEIRDCLMFLYGSGFPKSHNFGCKCTGDAVPYSHEKATESKTESSMRSLSDTNLSPSIPACPAENEAVFPGVPEQSLQSDRPLSFEGKENGKKSCLEGRNHLQEKQRELYRPQVCEMSKGISIDGEKGRIHNGTSLDNGEAFGENPPENRGSSSQGSQHAKQQYRKLGAVPQQQNTQNHRMAACENCGRLKGWGQQGTALKPAYEPIIMAMKPCDGTYKQNAEKWGQAGINIDACRIGTDDVRKKGAYRLTSKGIPGGGFGSGQMEYDPNFVSGSSKGRWPANVIFDEEASQLLGEPSRFFFNAGKAFETQCILCYNPCSKTESNECKDLSVPNVNQNLKIIQEISPNIAQKNAQLMQKEQFVQNVKYAGMLCDKCATNIAHALVKIKSLDFKKEELQVILDYIADYKSYILIQNLVSFAELWGNTDTIPTIQSLSILFGSVRHAIENYTKQENHNLNGKNEQLRFLYCAKTSSRERNEGLQGMPEIAKPLMGEFKDNPGRETPKSSPTPRQNFHPTVKPLKLMRYLITLIMPPKDGILLDPFAGSGSTIIAAHQLGVKAIGIEKQAEYVEIANKRLEYYKSFKEENEPDLFDQAVSE